MKFGNLYWQQTPDFAYPVDRRIREAVDLAVESEELGFEYAWFAEQHFHNYGYSPNPLMIAQAVAQRTGRLRVGTSILTLPLWNPVRLAEDIALLDIFSEGRVEVGVGRGFQHIGFRGFNVDLSLKQEVFDEALEVLIAAWSTDGLVYHGKHFDFPHGMNVLPKPVQSPFPPVWIAVTTEETLRWVARTDFHVFGSARFATKGRAQTDHELYLKLRSEAGLEGDHWTYALNRQMYVVPRGADYNAEKRNLEDRARYQRRMGQGLRDDNIGYQHGELIPRAFEGEETSQELFERVLFGYPEEVAEQLLEMNDVVPIDMVICQMDFGGIEHEKARLSQQLFGREVIPLIRRAVDSTAE